MDTSDGKAGYTVKKVTARELLEKFYYGRTEDVTRILRFASEHHLDQDDMVFLLTSILKSNENLIRLLLEALVAAEATFQNADLRATRLVKLSREVAIGQIEEATSRAVGRLNVAADQLSKSFAVAEELSVQLARSSQDVRGARDTLQQIMDLPEGSSSIDRL